ncbi:MAG: nuclear transport factor 2 family protein [Sphingobium sp.]
MDSTEIADRIAIAEVKARYCLSLDTKDWAGYADCFTEDLELDTRPAGGILIEGRDEAIRIVRRSVETAATCHHVHSPIITFNGDSTADVIWAMQDRVTWGPDRSFEPGLTGHTGFGHYREHYIKGADGRWRIARTMLTRLYTDLHYADGSTRPAQVAA